MTLDWASEAWFSPFGCFARRRSNTSTYSLRAASYSSSVPESPKRLILVSYNDATERSPSAIIPLIASRMKNAYRAAAPANSPKQKRGQKYEDQLLSAHDALTQQANRRPTRGRKPAGGRPVERRVRAQRWHYERACDATSTLPRTQNISSEMPGIRETIDCAALSNGQSDKGQIANDGQPTTRDSKREYVPEHDAHVFPDMRPAATA